MNFCFKAMKAIRERAVKGAMVAMLATFAIVLFSPANAMANTISVSPTPSIVGAGPYTWSYIVTLQGNSSINAGDFFTIFDFAGFIPGTQNVVAGWTASSANLGPCPADDVTAICVASDDGSTPNLTWTYNGAPLVNGDLVNGTVLGTFSANSTGNIPRNDAWVSQDNDLQTGTPDEGAFGNTNVPTPTPEPASIILLGGSLVGLAIARRKMSRD